MFTVSRLRICLILFRLCYSNSRRWRQYRQRFIQRWLRRQWYWKNTTGPHQNHSTRFPSCW